MTYLSDIQRSRLANLAGRHLTLPNLPAEYGDLQRSGLVSVEAGEAEGTIVVSLTPAGRMELAAFRDTEREN